MKKILLGDSIPFTPFMIRFQRKKLKKNTKKIMMKSARPLPKTNFAKRRPHFNLSNGKTLPKTNFAKKRYHFNLSNEKTLLQRTIRKNAETRT